MPVNAHSTRTKVALEDGGGRFGPGMAAHEDVESGESALRPGVNADVRLGEHRDAGDPASGREAMHVHMQECRAARRDRLAKHAFHAFEIIEEMRKGIVQTELEHWDSTHQQVVALLPENVPLDYERYLASIIYLGPLRSYPQRIYSLTDLGDDESTGVQGHLAPNALYGRPGSLDRLNAWFERFQIPYDLHIDRIARTELAGEYIVVVLRDRRSGTQVTIADVGFGINQILPVITEGVTSRPGSIICVEQPEIHLHPRLQAHLADLMIDTISEYDGEGKQWIAETHSELLILRIQRRIREGRLTSEDVSVIYVDPDEDGAGSNILQLDLDEEGNFVDEWPEGFFDEGFNELMADPEVDGM